MNRSPLGIVIFVLSILVLSLVALPGTSAQSPLQVTATPTVNHPLFFPALVRVMPGFPDAPTLSISQPSSNGNITLNWTHATGAKGYILWYSQSANMNDAQVIYRSITPSDTQYNYTVPVGTHYFRVQAVNQFGATPTRS